MRTSSRIAIDYLYITAGSAATALAITLFLNPAQLAPGGVSGISTILFHTLGGDLGTSMMAMTIPIFLIGMRVFGKQYGFRTLIGSVLLSVFTWIWTFIFGSEGILDYSKEMSLWLSALYGGVISGIGMGLVMKSGSNTGGTDIIAQIIARYTPITLGTSLFIVDAAIIAVSAVFFGIGTALTAMTVAYIAGAAINKVVLSMGTNYAKTVYIISDKEDEIGKYIMEELERGATVIDAEGCYTEEPRPMLMTVVPNQDIARLVRAIHAIDPGAFLIIQETVHVLGEGYTPIRKLAGDSDVTQR